MTDDKTEKGSYLTEEDWKSDAANSFAITLIALALILTLTPLALIAPTLTRLVVIPLLTLVAFSLFLLTFPTTDPVERITCWYYIFRFPGAVWHHYRNRK